MNRIHTKYYNYNDNYICVYYTNTLSVYNACVPNAQFLYSLIVYFLVQKYKYHFINVLSLIS